MDPKAYSQYKAWAAMTGVLMVFLLFQVATSLQCYSCIEQGDNGCSPANITVVQCAPPKNICIEFEKSVSVDAFTVILRKKGCSKGVDTVYGTGDQHDVFYHSTRFQTCSTDFCNKGLPDSTLTRNPYTTTDASVPNGIECYSCLSFSENQCSPQNAKKIQCTGHRTRCYEGNVTAFVDDDFSFKAIYLKNCALNDSCSRDYTLFTEHSMFKLQGSCCSGTYCNDRAYSTPSITTSKPNSQVCCSSVSHFSLLLGILIVTVVL